MDPLDIKKLFRPIYITQAVHCVRDILTIYLYF